MLLLGPLYRRFKVESLQQKTPRKQSKEQHHPPHAKETKHRIKNNKCSKCQNATSQPTTSKNHQKPLMISAYCSCFSPSNPPTSVTHPHFPPASQAYGRWPFHLLDTSEGSDAWPLEVYTWFIPLRILRVLLDLLRSGDEAFSHVNSKKTTSHQFVPPQVFGYQP